MNRDDVSKVLGDVMPEPPSPEGWAGASARRSRRSRRLRVAGVVAAVVAVVAVPVGSLLFSEPALVATPEPADPVGEVTDVEVTGSVSIFGTVDAPVLCLGAIAESYPPQCNGPAVKGAFSWDDVDYEDASGVRWTNDNYVVRGYYAPGDGPRGSFTLSAPVSVAPRPEPESWDFPQLCADPRIDANPALAGVEQQEALGAAAARLPLVSMWVSDGHSIYNVLVQGDAEAAFHELRSVWGGGLCVESSDAPTEARRIEALDAVIAAIPAGQVLSGDAGGVEPILRVQVVIATPEIEAAIRDAAGEVPVEIGAVFTPVDTTSSPSPEPPAEPSDPVEPALRVLSGVGMLRQGPDDSAPVLCVSVGYSHPIWCEGPALKGDFSWEEIPHEEVDGVFVSDQFYAVTGEFDPGDGPLGALRRHEAPVLASQPTGTMQDYSAYCDLPEEPHWPRVHLADPGAAMDGQSLWGKVCDQLARPVDDAKLDALTDAVDAAIPERIRVGGADRIGNSITVHVLAADDAFLAEVGAIVEDAGMPVAVRTVLTVPGESDVTLIVPSA